MSYDTFTEVAALLLDNERPTNEAAHEATRLAWLAIEAGDDAAGPATSLLARTLEKLTHAHPDIARAKAQGAATFALDFLGRALDAVDWLALARDWLAEEGLQREYADGRAEAGPGALEYGRSEAETCAYCHQPVENYRGRWVDAGTDDLVYCTDQNETHDGIKHEPRPVALP